MPATSIDTYFACILMVIVVFLSMAATASVAVSHFRGFEDLNEEDYLRKIAEYGITCPGNPPNWGQNKSCIPEVFGLAKEGSLSYDLDLDKVTRLSNQSAYELNYLEILEALRLEKVAVCYSVTQIMDVNILLASKVTIGNSTNYSFNVTVTRDQAPLVTMLKGYFLAQNFLDYSMSSTTSNGQGTIQIEIPNDSAGPVLLIVFARSPYDSRLTAQGSCSFAHLSPEPSPNLTFVNLSPLNNILQIIPNISDIKTEGGYVFTCSYNSTLIPISNTSYIVPQLLDSSIKVLAVTGWNGSDYFIEWTTYPQIPLVKGADFRLAESSSFDFLVTIDRVFYQLRVQCGGPIL